MPRMGEWRAPRGGTSPVVAIGADGHRLLGPGDRPDATLAHAAAVGAAAAAVPLQQQRDDAERKGQVGRQKIFDGLLTRLDRQEEAS